MNDLYKYAWLKGLFTQDTLYVIQDDSSREDEAIGEELQGISYNGQYTNGVVVIYNTTQTTFEESAEFVLLKKILQAVKCDIGQVARCNLHENADALTLSNIWTNLHPKKALLFLNEEERAQLGLEEVSYQVVEKAALGLSLVLADPLRALSEDDSLKRKLWIALQQLF